MAKFKTLAQFVAAEKKKGRKQFQIAAQLGLKESTLSGYLSQARTPSRDTARRIADDTGIPVENILFPDEASV